MAGVVSDQAELNILLNAVNFQDGSLALGLFKNDFVPDAGTTLAMLTEADFSGYARIGGFSVPATGQDGRAFTEKLNAVFTRAPGATSNTIYGWIIVHQRTQPSQDLLWACARLDAASPMNAEGNTITLNVTFKLREDS